MSPLPALLTLPLVPPESRAWSKAADRLARGPVDWADMFEALRLHRVDLFVLRVLRQTPMWTNVPSSVQDEEELRRATSQRAEAISRLALFTAASSLQSIQIVPVACKGIILGMDYYPEPGLRPMLDIDLWVEGDEWEAAVGVMSRLGFAPDGICKFTHTGGSAVTFDIHARMKLFEPTGKSLRELSRPHHSGCFRVFAPEYLLVHLVVHMLGHVPAVGLMLGWLVDLVLVLRRHADDLDWAAVRRLFPQNGSWNVLLRLIGMFSNLGWLEVPGPIRSDVGRVRPVSLDRVLRQRRLASWGLPAPRGWARLALTKLTHRLPEGRPALPTARDLWLLPYDRFIESTPIIHGSGGLLRKRLDHFTD